MRLERAAELAALAILTALVVPGCKGEDPPERKAQQTEAQKSAPAASGVRPKDPSERPASASRERGADDETIDGYRVIRARTRDGETTSIRIKPPKGWDVTAAPTEPDPHAGKFTLAEAVAGLPKKGTLAAQIRTTMGSFYCDLYEDKAPNTVANFVGLARGLRKFWDAEKLAWVARKYYDGTEFHRVIPGFMIQGGDHTGTGNGRIGYTIPDEVDPGRKHDRAGLLCMANRGPNTNEAQFFITEAAAPHIDGSYTIFGQCQPTGLVQRIARVPQHGKNRPITPVTIEQVEIRRIEGGIAKWMPKGLEKDNTVPTSPPGRAVMVGPDGQPVELPKNR